MHAWYSNHVPTPYAAQYAHIKSATLYRRFTKAITIMYLSLCIA